MINVCVGVWVCGAQEYSLEKSEQLYEVLNRKHFMEGCLLNDVAVLMEALEEIGDVDVAACELFLRSSDGVVAVLRTVDLVHSMGMFIALTMNNLVLSPFIVYTPVHSYEHVISFVAMNQH
jgi:hypothetical protein